MQFTNIFWKQNTLINKRLPVIHPPPLPSVSATPPWTYVARDLYTTVNDLINCKLIFIKPILYWCIKTCNTPVAVYGIRVHIKGHHQING